MSERDYYPLGAYDDPDAPYNEKEIPEKEFGVLCSQTLSKSTKCSTSDYIYDDYFEPAYIDTSETNWKDVYAENDRRTPLQLIDLFKNYLSNKLTGNPPVSESSSFLKHLMEDCEGWIEDETIIMEDY